MRHLLSIALTWALFVPCLGAHADMYTDVHRLIQNGELRKAHDEAQRRLQSQPTDPQMRLLLSRIQDAQGDSQAAIQTLQALTQSFPELPEPHNNLAVLLAKDNRPAQALVALQAAIQVKPDYLLALENMGDVYVALAMEAYAKAFQLNPLPRIENKRLTAEKLLQSSPP